jgi:wyosine [tRNA(Phe)-imidazoG37] synthetase (radical SAM superfamily)
MDVAREFRDNKFVYTLISQRNRGLCIGVNLVPDKQCNFNCSYCEVDRSKPGGASEVDVERMQVELRETLRLVMTNHLRSLPGYESLPQELLRLKAVTLSGEGESTLCPNFAEVIRAVVHVRAQGEFPFFKVALLTNGTCLDLPQVKRGLHMLTGLDEIWVKLDAGSQDHMDRVNQPTVPLDRVLTNILTVGRDRPLVIQSLFPMIDGIEPSPREVDDYVERLRELKEGGARIEVVQIYSAHRQAVHRNCEHLPLKSLSRIAQLVRERTGLSSEVF